MEQSKFYQIKNITEHEYILVGCEGNVITRPIQYVDKSASAFTIADAKDGDVLAATIEKCPKDFIYIFKSRSNYKPYGFKSHCYVMADTHRFSRGDWHNTTNFGTPATKEQREILFQKMKEAGYEWDAEKKELKKIEPKSSWKEDPK